MPPECENSTDKDITKCYYGISTCSFHFSVTACSINNDDTYTSWYGWSCLFLVHYRNIFYQFVWVKPCQDWLDFQMKHWFPGAFPLLSLRWSRAYFRLIIGTPIMVRQHFCCTFNFALNVPVCNFLRSLSLRSLYTRFGSFSSLRRTFTKLHNLYRCEYKSWRHAWR